jgi:hypothetical protein
MLRGCKPFNEERISLWYIMAKKFQEFDFEGTC